MAFRPPSYDDIVNSKFAAAMPATTVLPQTETRNYFQAIDNLIKSTRSGLATTCCSSPTRCSTAAWSTRSPALPIPRGVFPREFMAPTTADS
jgi:hypothetical protein